MLWMINALITVGIFVIGRKLLFVIEPEMKAIDKEQTYAFWTAMLYIGVTALITREEDILCSISGCFFWGSLTLAAYSDYLTTEIYNFIYLPATVVSVVLLLMKGTTVNILADLIIFCLLQGLLFSRMYGKADCYAFCVCAFYIAASEERRLSGEGLLKYLLHMAATFLLVAIVQTCKRNINEKGNLKKPIALVPYIAASMILMQIMK